jgi:predicted nucleic acid-binding protein
LLGAFYEDNPDHEACVYLLGSLDPSHDACGAHSLAEAYSTLTRVPPPKRIGAGQAGIFLGRVQSRLLAISLTSEEYSQELQRAVESRTTGGQIYDALLLACARKHAANQIYTLNLRHFRKLAPDLADRIVIPKVLA